MEFQAVLTRNWAKKTSGRIKLHLTLYPACFFVWIFYVYPKPSKNLPSAIALNFCYLCFYRLGLQDIEAAYDLFIALFIKRIEEQRILMKELF